MDERYKFPDRAAADQHANRVEPPSEPFTAGQFLYEAGRILVTCLILALLAEILIETFGVH